MNGQDAGVEGREAAERRARARSEERYALAVRAADEGIWDWDLAADRVYFSSRWSAILGRPEDAGEEDPSVWFDLVHDDDLLRLRAAIDAHLSGNSQRLEFEHRIRH